VGDATGWKMPQVGHATGSSATGGFENHRNVKQISIDGKTNKFSVASERRTVEVVPVHSKDRKLEK
jgi:hypothetical protein